MKRKLFEGSRAAAVVLLLSVVAFGQGSGIEGRVQEAAAEAMKKFTRQ